MPVGGAGSVRSSLARMRNDASLTPCGITRTVHVPGFGSLTKASASNWLAFAADAATAPLGSITSTWKVSSRIGVSSATRSRAAGWVSRSV